MAPIASESSTTLLSTMAVAPNMEAASYKLKTFLATKNPSLLDDPINFETETGSFCKYLCCQGFIGCMVSWGLTAVFCPIGTCAPCCLTNHFSLQLDRDSIKMTSAANDFCCHIAKSSKSVPLDKVQDVELTAGCIESCCGVQSVLVQTAGAGGSDMPEVAAAFLANPAEVREAIQLAVKLTKSGALAAPGAMTMGRDGTPGGSSLASRLGRLEALVNQGVLSPQEAEGIKLTVLGAEVDPLGRLAEAAALAAAGRLTPAELGTLKKMLLSQIH